VFGLETTPDKGLIHVRHGRTLSLPIMFEPLISITPNEDGYHQEASVVHYLTGIAHRLQCRSSGLMVAHQYYAHRTLPSLFVQDIKITNPNDELIQVTTEQNGLQNWPSASTYTVRYFHFYLYIYFAGMLWFELCTIISSW
jgi:hypothetical protein